MYVCTAIVFRDQSYFCTCAAIHVYSVRVRPILQCNFGNNTTTSTNTPYGTCNLTTIMIIT